MYVASIEILDEFTRQFNMPAIVFPEKGVAIHRTFELPDMSIFWSVTHLLSGCCVCSGLHSYQHARRFIDRFPLASGIDFTLGLDEIVRKHCFSRRQRAITRSIVMETFNFTQEVKGEYVPRAIQLSRRGEEASSIEHC